MTHKLQLFPPKNNGLDSIVRKPNSTSNAEIISNDAGLGSRLPVETQHAASLHTLSHCEVARSAGYDPTGEHAVACGALAQVVCEYCGPMCSTCAEETFCYYGEHKFVDFDLSHAATRGDPEALSQPSKPLFEVIYLELTCPHCKQVRLALPRAVAPDADWKLVCPICSALTTWRYLAHGITQRDLPFHELFDPEAAGKGRIPWDQLARLLDADDEDDL
jgi:hypothetical protein